MRAHECPERIPEYYFPTQRCSEEHNKGNIVPEDVIERDKSYFVRKMKLWIDTIKEREQHARELKKWDNAARAITFRLKENKSDNAVTLANQCYLEQLHEIAQLDYAVVRDLKYSSITSSSAFRSFACATNGVPLQEQHRPSYRELLATAPPKTV